MLSGTSGYLRAKHGAAFLDVADSTWWRLTQEEGFPKALKVSGNCTVWKISELVAWMDAKKEAA